MVVSSFPIHWAKHYFAAPNPMPPPEGEEVVFGLPRGDRLVTAGDIEDEIRQSNAAGIAAKLEGWSTSKHRKPATPVSHSETVDLIGHEYPSSDSPPPPDEVLVTPGEGFWRDQEVVDRAKAEFAEWESRQEKLPVIAAEKKQAVDRYVSPVKQEFEVEFD